MIPERIGTLLIANRGEIAVRIMRTARERGIRTIAVYSEADRHAYHVRIADEAHSIGPAPSRESYLVGERILDVARRAGADAVHPGYGFLSENAEFAEACATAGVTWVGPPASAIRAMGDKTAARALMRAAGVPMVPGTPDAVSEVHTAAEIAEAIGYPVLVKAAAGGGGKGMRTVASPAELPAALEAARSEASSAFGDGRVYIEKLVTRPRHVEIQVLADAEGNTVHLFERECSVQRRHQKVVEEAPSSVLTPALRDEMGAAAVAAARACGYVGAGTVEFLLDAERRFYFLEMNTRLQVEHPVTEWITGIDLVAEQIRVAEGEPLGYGQDDISLHGHAVEARVYAENVAAGFLPDPGTLLRHRPPGGPGVRVDAGVEEGDEVPIHYDPMIAKITTWGPSRRAALDRMDRALSEYDVAGVRTTIPFCRFVVGHEAFRSGDFHTGFVEDHFDAAALAPPPDAVRAAAVAAALGTAAGASGPSPAAPDGDGVSRWAARRLPT
jgi:propionyl-CoA carboxylase alpha chain